VPGKRVTAFTFIAAMLLAQKLMSIAFEGMPLPRDHCLPAVSGCLLCWGDVLAVERYLRQFRTAAHACRHR
jgi:hypothetical protein